MEMGLIFILAVVPVGVFGTSAAATPLPTTPTPPPPLTYMLAEDDPVDDPVLRPLFTDLRNLSETDAEKYLNSSVCHDLNNQTNDGVYTGVVYVNTMEEDSSIKENKINGPHAHAHVIPPNSPTPLEERFHKNCPANPAFCDKGYTIAMWFSILASNEQWAATWPGNCNTTLVSINNHIVITSMTKKAEESSESLHKVQIDLNPEDGKNMTMSLSNKNSFLMEGNIDVCKQQTEGTNCTSKPLEQTKVGWQWNHLAMVVKENAGKHVVRLYWNGNAVPKDNISTTDIEDITLSEDVNGIKLNMPISELREQNVCKDIGFDNFGMWEKPLSHGDILRLHSADFCDPTTTVPPPKPIAEVIDTKVPTGEEAAELVKNKTKAAAEVAKLVSTFSTLNDSADIVKPDELKEYVDNTLGFIETVASSSGIFTADDGDTTVSTDLAEQIAGALHAALDITDKSSMDKENKEQVTQAVVDTCTELTKNLLASGQDSSITNGDISIEFHETTPVIGDNENLVAKIGDVEVSSSAFEAGKSIKLAVLTLKFEAIKHIPVKVSPDENSEQPIAVAGDIKIIQMDSYTEGTQFPEPIIIRNTIKEYNESLSVPNCVYMKADNTWATDGIETISNKEADGSLNVVCKCSHLTNFAVLMSVTPIKISQSHAQSLSTLTIVCISISLIALFIALVILFVFSRELRGTRISILKHLSIAMFVAQLMFITAVEKAVVNRKLCLVVAVFIHYLFLSVFFWMLAQGIFLYMKLRLAVRSDANIVWFCLIGWGFPAVMVTVTAGINIEAYQRDDLCWLNLEGGGVWAFVGPVLAIVMLNTVVIVMAMKAFTSVKSFKDKDDKEKFKSTLKAMVVMLPLLGLTWFFGVFAHIPGTGGLAFMYIFALCNGLQGLFLFLFHIVFNAEVQKVIKHAILRRSGSVGSEEPSFIRKMMGPESGVTQTSDFGKSTM